MEKCYQGTVRKVWNDDRTVCLGVVGTVGDLLREGIFEFCAWSPDTWSFVSAFDPYQGVRFGRTRESVLVN